jgi:REP element-mobilizing transposase RayT
MPRIPRLDDFGSFHHVMNRGARQAPIFGDADAYHAFLDLIAGLPEQHGVQVHAFALLPSHFHLLLTAGPRGLGPALQMLQSGYSRWLNRRRQWDGPVWRSRFRSRRIDDPENRRQVLAFLHFAPVKEQLALRFDRADWTSHPYYAGERIPPDWLSTRLLRDDFGTVEAYLEYTERLQQKLGQSPSSFDPSALWVPSPSALSPPSRAPERRGPMSMDDAWRVLEKVTESTRDQLTTRSRGRARQWRWWLTLWWLPRASGRPSTEVARELGTHPTALSRARARVQGLAREDDGVAAMLEVLKDRLGTL